MRLIASSKEEGESQKFVLNLFLNYFFFWGGCGGGSKRIFSSESEEGEEDEEEEGKDRWRE